ncbi:MAG TPA: ABC transporter permease [Actinomycetota bacterium]|jgi:ABC transporter DrrB family efflux protein|nr:ABC transporter permease [Actinomycetota bacterium]
MTALALALADGATIAKRNLIKSRRMPDVLVWTTMQPIMFVLLFAYIFGGSIDIPGTNYREFLIAGIFAQNIIFGSSFTGYGLADDMQKGIIDRFRSLPMARSAVLAGRTASDVVNNAIALTVMAITGLVVGWRLRTSVFQAIAGFALLLLFGYTISWVMAWVGLKVRTPEVVNNAAFMFIFPMTFIANTFVPSQNLPGVLRTIAEWNPVSALAQAARELFGNSVAYTSTSDAWSLNHPVLYVLMWTAVILGIFVPLAVREYARTKDR